MNPQDKKTWKILEVLNWSAEHLKEKGFDNPRLTAELLLGHGLGLSRVDLYLQFDRVLTEAEIAGYRQALRQRLRHVPVQHILGHAEFYSLRFAVNRAAFIPRPETEILVESVLKYLAGADGDLLVGDIGTGCGVIAVVLAHEMPKLLVYATDCCAEALELAKGNAQRHGLEGRVVFLEGDLLGPLRGLRDDNGTPLLFDAIVSNPPYVRRDDMDLLPDEVRDYEPWVALDGGPDGLLFYRKLAAEASDFLKPGGSVFLEVGDGQADAVAACIRQNLSFGEVQRVRDLNGVERVLAAEKVQP